MSTSRTNNNPDSPLSWEERKALGQRLIEEFKSGAISRELMIEDLSRLLRSDICRRLRVCIAKDRVVAVLDKDEADSNFEDAMFKIWKHADRLDPQKNPISYVWRSAINTQISYVRSRRFRNKQTAEPLDEASPVIENSAARYSATEYSRHAQAARELESSRLGALSLAKALDTLDPLDRLVVEWIQLDGWSERDVAKKLRCSAHKVGYHLRLGMAALRTALGAITEGQGVTKAGEKDHERKDQSPVQISSCRRAQGDRASRRSHQRPHQTF